MNKMKKDKQISIGNNYEFAQRLDLYIKSKANFTLDISNYTQTIYFNEKAYQYSLSSMTVKTFALYNKIKKDLTKNARKVAEIINSFDPFKTKYYSVRYGLVPQTLENACCFDLNNAYSTILYTMGLVSRETLDYLNSASKPERLAAVGMLATSKNRHYYESGEISDVEIIANPYAPLFFNCVQITHEITEYIKDRFPDFWLLTWVDGVYFKGGDFSPPQQLKNEIMQDVLKNYGISLKYEKIINFDIKRKGVNILLDYKKFSTKKNKYEIKKFTFPDPNILTNVKKIYGQ